MYIKKSHCLKSDITQLNNNDKRLIINDLRYETNFSIVELCSYLNISLSSYYYKSINKHDENYKDIKSKILDIYNKHNGRYGYRRIRIELMNNGYHISLKTVNKLMQELNIHGIQKSKGGRYNSYKGKVGKIASNIIDRNFTSDKPYVKMFTDVTEFKFEFDGTVKKMYLSPVLDAFNGEIITYTISNHGDLKLVLDMMDQLNDILETTNDDRILHSDQGFQYQNRKYIKKLEKHHIIQSMSRKGTCYDNGMMEGFFGKLKTEFFYQEKFENISDFLNKLDEYIYYYNNERINTTLKTSPIKYRLKMCNAA